MAETMLPAPPAGLYVRGPADLLQGMRELAAARGQPAAQVWRDAAASFLAAARAEARWVGQCRAVDAETGHRCRGLTGHVGSHRSERGPFERPLAPGEVPARPIDAVATSRTDEPGIVFAVR
jgi:hypothetical protein